MKAILLLLCFLLMNTFTFSGNDPFPVGARIYGLANTGVTLSETFSLFNNPAGLANLDHIGVSSYFDLRYNQSGLSVGSLALAYPTEKLGTAGLGFYRFGDKLYNETRLCLAYGHKIGFMSLGTSVEYLNVTIAEIGSKSNVAISMGGIAALTEKIYFGAHIYNLNRAKLADFQNERVPTIMKAGLSYRPMQKLMVNIEVEKDLIFPAIYKAGVEYGLFEFLRLRTGINAEPVAGFFGVGMNYKGFYLDYALSRNAILGFTHHFSLSYRLVKKDNKLALVE